ncbi:MAG: hypothetical protein WBB48_11240 [Thermodesulfobacteriota bacterium]
MKRKLFLFAAFFSLIFTLMSCQNRTWRDPDNSIASQNVSIANLISNRQAYDSAGVSLIGKVWNLETNTTTGKNEDGLTGTYTTFMLADREGTSVDVYATGEAPIEEGDFVRVIGIYRKQFELTGDYFLNVVDAVRIEEWNPGFGYWLRELEFD